MINIKDILSSIRHFLLIAVIPWLFPIMSWAVDPSTTLTTYYANIDGKATDSNDALRVALYNIINSHTTISYGNLQSSVYAATSNPSDFNNGSSKTLEDIYSSKAYVSGDNGTSATNCGEGWNKEHTIPQSWFDGASPMYSDAHHIFPTDIKMNSVRSNYPFGENNASKSCSSYGYGHLGSSTFSGYSGTVFDPGDPGNGVSYKGDIARVYFYMVTCYRNKNFTQDNQNNGQVCFTYSSNVAQLTTYMQNLLMKWHREDPVSEKELIRNNAIYAHQGNRNPFVDYPCLAEYIWGDLKGQTVSLSSLVSGYEGTGTDCCGSSSATYYTVTWMANGSQVSSGDVREGSKPTLPSTPSACSSSRVFMGWTTNGSYSGNSAPSGMFTTSSDAPSINSATTFYAVYADVTTSGGSGGSTTVSMSSFSAISGDIDGDTNVSYAASQGSAANAPAIYSNIIRIYQNGGQLTITANNSKKLSSITIGSSMGTTVTYAVDGGSASGNQSIAANGTYTLSGINASSVVFTCTGTTSSTRLYLNSLSVTYTGGGTTTYSNYSTSCVSGATVTITFHANGGTGTMSPQTIPQSTSTALVANTFTRDGYTFAGWATSSGGAVVYADGANVNTDSDLDLYAKWTALPTYTVTWKVNGATYTTGGPTTSVVSGNKVSQLPTNPSVPTACSSKTFVGWSATNIGSTASSTRPTDLFTSASGSPAITSDTTFYAVFAEEEESTTIYDRVTDLSQLDDASSIVIVNAYASSNFVLTTSLATAVDAPTETNGQITVSNSSYKWNLAQSGSSWTFSTGSAYLGATTIPTSSNKSAAVSLTSSNRTWDISANSYTGNGNNCFTIVNAASATAGLEYSSGWKLYYATNLNTSWYTLKLYVPAKEGTYVTECAASCTVTVTAVSANASQGSVSLTEL